MSALVRWALLPIVLIFAYLVAGTLGGIIPGSLMSNTAPQPHQILLVKGPIHTDIAVPLTPAMQERFPWLDDPLLNSTGWVLFGWGALDFYTTTGTYADLSPGPILRAVTGDASVMRVDLIPNHWVPQDVTVIAVSEAQRDRLLDAIAAGFADPVTPLDHPGFTSTDTFYAGAGRFHLFRTCNVWVGEVLADAGLNVGIWTPFTWSLP